MNAEKELNHLLIDNGRFSNYVQFKLTYARLNCFVCLTLKLPFHLYPRVGLGYPLAPHSKIKSSPNFFATVFLSLLSNHGVTEIMMMMMNIVVIKNNNNDNNNADKNMNDKADGNTDTTNYCY